MLNVRQLDKTIDSLKIISGADMERKIDREVGINYTFVKRKILPHKKNQPVPKVVVPPESIQIRDADRPIAPKPLIYNQRKSIVSALAPPEGIWYARILPDSARRMVISRAVDQVSSQKNSLDIIVEEARMKQKSLRFHLIEWHRKFALSLACIVLFLIGAPLGSIIRKGGMGMPLVIAVIFFLIFHLLNMFGEKFVREDITSAFWGMWLSTLVLLPIGIFFTYKAMHDSQLFNKEFYYRLFKGVRLFVKKLQPSEPRG